MSRIYFTDVIGVNRVTFEMFCLTMWNGCMNITCGFFLLRANWSL